MYIYIWWGGEYDGRKYYCFAASRISRRSCHLIVLALQFTKSVALVTKPMIEACYKKKETLCGGWS